MHYHRISQKSIMDIRQLKSIDWHCYNIHLYINNIGDVLSFSINYCNHFYYKCTKFHCWNMKVTRVCWWVTIVISKYFRNISMQNYWFVLKANVNSSTAPLLVTWNAKRSRTHICAIAFLCVYGVICQCNRATFIAFDTEIRWHYEFQVG